LNITLPGTLMLGAASGFLGKLAVALNQFDEARTLLEEALAFNEGMAAAPVLAATKIDYARMLLMTGSEPDAVRARQLLGGAHVIAKRLNLHAIIRAIDALSAQSDVGALTDREAEVLKLVAGGFSNGRIADCLKISHSTVATHLRHIFRKTGASNRTEAADFARRNGLLEHG